MSQLKIEQFVQEHFGIKLTKHQLEMIAIMAATPEREFILAHQGRSTGKSTAYKVAIAYLQHSLKPADTAAVDRFEVIDHRQCVWCRGRKLAGYTQKDGSIKDLPCDKCKGSGISGGRVYTVSSNPERSIVKVDLSYQDEGRTLKVFINDKEKS